MAWCRLLKMFATDTQLALHILCCQLPEPSELSRFFGICGHGWDHVIEAAGKPTNFVSRPNLLVLEHDHIGIGGHVPIYVR